jgi:hypothetical protein
MVPTAIRRTRTRSSGLKRYHRFVLRLCVGRAKYPTKPQVDTECSKPWCARRRPNVCCVLDATLLPKQSFVVILPGQVHGNKYMSKDTFGAVADDGVLSPQSQYFVIALDDRPCTSAASSTEKWILKSALERNLLAAPRHAAFRRDIQHTFHTRVFEPNQRFRGPAIGPYRRWRLRVRVGGQDPSPRHVSTYAIVYRWTIATNPRREQLHLGAEQSDHRRCRPRRVPARHGLQYPPALTTPLSCNGLEDRGRKGM